MALRLIVLVIVIAVALGGYFFFEAPRYDETKLYQVECTDIKGSAGELLKCGSDRDRRRLSFANFTDKYPEFAARVVALRDRVRESEASGWQTANWAMNWHLRLVGTSIVLLAIVLLFPLKTSENGLDKKLDFSLSGLKALLEQTVRPLTILVVLFIAMSQGFAFHTKYQAGFVAAQQLRTLAITIDAELIDFISNANNNKEQQDTSDALSALVKDWADDYRDIETKFAETYGGSFALISIPLSSVGP